MVIDKLTHDSIRRVIAKAPYWFAFYMSMAAEVAETIKLLESKRESRTSMLYAKFDEPKRTESWKKNSVYNDGATFFNKVDTHLAKLETLRSKLRAIAQAFDMQVKALQTSGALLRSEIEMILQSETNPMDE